MLFLSKTKLTMNFLNKLNSCRIGDDFNQRGLGSLFLDGNIHVLLICKRTDTVITDAPGKSNQGCIEFSCVFDFLFHKAIKQCSHGLDGVLIDFYDLVLPKIIFSPNFLFFSFFLLLFPSPSPNPLIFCPPPTGGKSNGLEMGKEIKEGKKEKKRKFGENVTFYSTKS